MATFQSTLVGTTGFEFPVGETQDGQLIKADLTQINHLLVTGTTGSGKSVFVDSLLLALMFHNTPDKMRFILCDTKSTEFTQYNSTYHLLVPVCTSSKNICGALQWTGNEANKRLRLFAEAGVKNISAYNNRSWEQFGEELSHIVIAIDDLSVVVGSAPEVCEPIKHILSVGRTVGIHLVAITQTPAAKYTKEISSLFFSKAIFQTASLSDYRFLTGKRAALSLSNPGDVLFCNGISQMQVHTFMPGINDTNNVLESVRDSAAKYDGSAMYKIEKAAEDKDKAAKGVGGSVPTTGGDAYDELLPAAIDVVLEVGQASVSMLQHRLKLGYGRAARLVDQMEEKGVVGPFEGSKPRVILITKEQWQQMQYREETMREDARKEVEEEIERAMLADMSESFPCAIDDVAPVVPDPLPLCEPEDETTPLSEMMSSIGEEIDDEEDREAEETQNEELPPPPQAKKSLFDKVIGYIKNEIQLNKEYYESERRKRKY